MYVVIYLSDHHELIRTHAQKYQRGKGCDTKLQFSVQFYQIEVV